MSVVSVYLVAAIAVWVVALVGFLLARNILKKIIVLNVMASATFLLFATIAFRGPDAVADPVVHALVITGIVVSFSATALAVGIARRLHAATGATELPEDRA